MRFPDVVLELMTHLEVCGYQPLLTGGAVRDLLLNMPVNDYDIEVFGATDAAVLLADLKKKFPRAKEVGRSFGVFDVSHYPEHIQVSVPREEIKIGSGHTDYKISPTKDIYTAALRRDLTVNAIFMDKEGLIFDPMAGVIDLKNRVLRPCSPRFAEDALRIYRVFQLSSRLHMTPTPELVEMSRQMLDELALVSVDRVAEEWWKWATKSVTPSLGIQFLRDCGALDRFYPELAAMEGVAQDPVWHSEGDVFVHTLLVIDALTEVNYITTEERAAMLLSGLLHDTGKATTTVVSEDSGRLVAPGHAEVSTEIAKEFLRKIRAPQAVVNLVIPLVSQHMARLDQRQASGIRRLAVALAPATIRQHLILSYGDRRGQLLTEARAWEEFETQLARAEAVKVGDSKPEPLLLGRHLLAENLMKPGPAMGELLDKVYEAQLDGKISTQEEALELAKSLLFTADDGIIEVEIQPNRSEPMAVDVKMWVGKQYYSLGSYIYEAQHRGVSKRIPASSIPDIIPGRSRLFLIYPEAITLISKGEYALLEYDLFMYGLLEEFDLACKEWEGLLPELLEANTPMPQNMIKLRIALETLEKNSPADYKDVVESYGITYKPGVFAYAFLTGIQYVARKDEEGLPEKYQHLEGLVEPVRVITQEDE